MIYEDLRYALEDAERLEAAIAERILLDPKHIRSRALRDHEIANLLSRIQTQSERALRILNDTDARTAEIQSISTGDTFAEFYKQLEDIKAFHKKYPNEPVENLERAYKRTEHGGPSLVGDINSMFTGEEAFGRYLDLTMMHEEYLNLPGIKGSRKLTYLQYLDIFDKFVPPHCKISLKDKMMDEYFSYVSSLSQYLESFMRRTKPLEDLDKLFRSFDDEFNQQWQENKVPGWELQGATTNGGAADGPATEGSGDGVWCADCQKEFKNDNVYKAHLTGKKHIKNVELRKERSSTDGPETTQAVPNLGARLKERAIAEREHRIRKLASAMQTIREDTRVNVERKAGMTDRERQQELAALYAEDTVMGDASAEADDTDEQDGEEKIYNPLKLPLAWDGKPIPFWLYKLHGLGVEFPCEICGNFVYMGRRAFEKHFSEARHVYGLKCLGIHGTSLFREITKIDEALQLWEKIQKDKQAAEDRKGGVAVIEMEDSEGNVMPKKVYDDLLKAGLL